MAGIFDDAVSSASSLHASASAAIGSPAGAAIGAATGVDFATLLGQLPAAAQSTIAGVLTPALRSALAEGAQVAGDLSPTLAVIGKIASGQALGPEDALFAMAGVATLINPAAGALMLAAGTFGQMLADGLNDLFRQVGLQAETPRPRMWIGGKGVDVDMFPAAPDARGNYDPLWKRWTAAPGGLLERVPASIAGATLHAPEFFAPFLREADAPHDVGANGMVKLLWSMAAGDRPAGMPDLTRPAAGFETFFATLLQKDGEYWWNGAPYLNPRDLLGRAADAWNTAHGAARTVTYQPGEDKSATLPAYVLSGATDTTGVGRRGHPVPVNVGAFTGAAAKAPAAAAPASPARVTLSPADVAAIARHAGQTQMALPAANVALIAARAAAQQTNGAGASSSSPLVPIALLAAGGGALLYLTHRR